MSDPVTSGTPEEVFNDLQYDIGTQIMRLDIGPHAVDITMTSRAMTASVQPFDAPDTVMDCIVLTHDFVFSPTLRFQDGSPCAPRIARYQIAVYPEGTGIVRPGGDDGDQLVFMGNPYPRTIDMVKATPETTESSTSFSVGTSDSLSGNIGMFGGDPNGSLSGTVSFSTSKSWEVPDLRVRNTSRSPFACFDFLIGSDPPDLDGMNAPMIATSTLEPTVQSYFKISDIPGGKRNLDPNDRDAENIVFVVDVLAEVMWWAYPAPGTVNPMNLLDSVRTHKQKIFHCVGTQVYVRTPPRPEGTDPKPASPDTAT